MNQQVTAKDIRRQARGEVASQAAGVEHSRAVAEVQAAVTVAQRFPRDETRSLEKALSSCAQWEVAETAFFKLPRGNESVTGETIHLAVELARCWGNVDYGIMELARDDAAHESEMLAFAWDLETNTKARMTFIVPHKRDKRGSTPVLLTEMQGIYENNANHGARRLRECIFRILPPYLKEQARQACYMTLERGQGDKPLEVRIAEAVKAFSSIGIARDRLEAKVGPVRNWTAADLANLQVSFRSIGRNEVTAEDEFPRAGVEDTVATAQRIAETSRAGAAAATPTDQQEGPAEEQRGEAHAEAEGDAELRRLAIDTIRRASTLQTRDEFDDLEMEIADRLSEMPPALVDEVNAALDEAQTRIARIEKKGAK